MTKARISLAVASAVLAGLLLFLGGSVWGQAYRIDRFRNRVVVDTRDHWSNWSFPKGTVHITPDGKVQPRLLRRDINAVLDASEFGGGIKSVGSNPRDAANVIDGDPETFWEPDINDPLPEWSVEIDLGRAVQAKKVVIRFAEDGDPFLQFRVYISYGGMAYRGSNLIHYVTLGKTTKPNKVQRIFEFIPKFIGMFRDPEPTFEGEVIQFIRIQATDSDFDRGREITEEEYEALDADRKGAIVYYRKTIFGTDREITKEEYDLLPPEKQGSIRYYRREIPRLAEVEVLSEGDNIGLGTIERGGTIHATGVSPQVHVFDGDFTSEWNAFVYSPYRERGLLTVDLGGVFWVDRINILTYVRQTGWLEGTLYGYVTRVSDGSRAPDGTLIWDVISPKSREDNPNMYIRFTDDFPIRKVRYIEFKNIDITGTAAGGYAQYGYINEMQVYGRGYMPEVVMESGLIELGGSRNLTSIDWVGDSPPGTRIEIQTRTGDDLKEVKHYYDKSGNEVTERKWNDLPGFMKGPVESEFVIGGGWSSWSPPYQRSGDPITSPSPRKYAMIRVRLVSEDPDLSSLLDSITLNFLPPVASKLEGELYPADDVRVGKPRLFSFYIKPSFGRTDPGIDEILIQAPPAVDMELFDVSLGSEDDFINGEEESFTRDASGNFVNPDGDLLEVVKDRSDSLWVRVPDVVKIGKAWLFRVRFTSTIFLNGTLFKASVANSNIEGSWQRVDAGDATFLTPSKGTIVSVPVSPTIVGDLTIDPNPFTPNGDGVNDKATFRFTVFKVNMGEPVNVRIYNLAGQMMRELSEQRSSAAGIYSIVWDGKDASEKLVPPGIYLCQVDLDVDTEAAEDSSVSQLVYVAY